MVDFHEFSLINNYRIEYFKIIKKKYFSDLCDELFHLINMCHTETYFFQFSNWTSKNDPIFNVYLCSLRVCV